MRKHAVAAAVTIAALAGCTTVVQPAASTSARPVVAATSFNAQAVTLAGCLALARWENDPASTGAEGDAHTSVQVQKIIRDSAGTQFSTDLLTWVDETDPDTAIADSTQVNIDCAAVGVPNVIGSS